MDVANPVEVQEEANVVYFQRWTLHKNSQKKHIHLFKDCLLSNEPQQFKASKFVRYLYAYIFELYREHFIIFYL